MKNLIIRCTLVLSVLMLAIACSQENVEPNEKDLTKVKEQLTRISEIECDCKDEFEKVPKGPFGIGDAIKSPCLEAITFEEFFFLGGGSTTSGTVTVQPAPAQAPHMSGQTLFASNINLRFNLPCTVDGLCIDVFDAGGNLNIEVNGQFVNFANFQDIDGQNIGGAIVSITYDANGKPIRLCLHGQVSAFMLGGQELFLDNLCLGPCVEKCACVIDFEITDPGPFKVGDGTFFERCEIEARFRDFQWSNGVWYSGGQAAVVNSPVSWLSGQVMQLNNINMELGLPCEIDGLCMDIAELGGNLNLLINGDFVNFGSYAALDGSVVGGVTVHVTYNGSGDPIRVCFDGPIGEFMIGGQEFFVDNICLGPCL